MKKLFFALTLLATNLDQAMASCETKDLIARGSFARWEHPDYGWICSFTEATGNSAVTITNCSSVPFLECERSEFRLKQTPVQNEQGAFCVHQVLTAICHSVDGN